MEITVERINKVQAKAYRRNDFLDSIAFQLQKGKTLSEKQVAAAEKVLNAIVAKADERKAKIEAENAKYGTWDEARQTVSGKVIEIKQATRWEGGHYYGTEAIVDKVKLECQDGKTIIFTATATCYEENKRAVYSFEKETPLKFGIGDAITVDVTVKPHKEITHWAYGSRATFKA
jgi:hypothetical protein